MSTQEHAHTGANPQMTRQSFITAEVAKAGSIEALEGKYGIGESIVRAWINGTAEKDTIELLYQVHAASDNDGIKTEIAENICRISQALTRLDKAYKEATS